MALNLDHLVDQGLHNADTHLVVARLGFVVDRDQVQVDAEKYSLDLKFIDELLKDLAQFEKALDYQTWEFVLHSIVFMSTQQVEKHAEDRCLVAVFEAAQHGAVEVVHYELALIFVAKLVQIVDQQASQELLDQLVKLLLTHHRHDDAALAGLVDDSDEVLGKAQWCVLSGSLKDVNEDVAKRTD